MDTILHVNKNVPSNFEGEEKVSISWSRKKIDGLKLKGLLYTKFCGDSYTVYQMQGMGFLLSLSTDLRNGISPSVAILC